MTLERPRPTANDPPSVRMGNTPGGFCAVCESRIRRIDQRQMNVLEGIHNGRRAFIIGAGTSLGKIPGELFDRLSVEVTFGVNFLTRWDGLRFRPTYWCVSEEEWLLPIERELAAWETGNGYERTPRFFAKNRLPKLLDEPPLDDYTRIHVDGSSFIKDGRLGGIDPLLRWGCRHFAFSGYSVVVDCALQLALHMGADPVYLLGVDGDRWGHIYDDPSTDEHPMKEELRVGLIENVSHAAVSAALAVPARAVVNATPGGLLEIPRTRLEDVL